MLQTSSYTAKYTLEYLECRNSLHVLYIQGVTGGMCETSGECSLGQTIPT